MAGLPTNVNFLQKLANHWAFENGNVETHFIDNYKEDLFVDANNSMSAKAYEAARLGASFVAACLIEKEHLVLSRNPPGIVPFLLYEVLSCVLYISFEFTSLNMFRWQQLTPYMVCFTTF